MTRTDTSGRNQSSFSNDSLPAIVIFLTASSRDRNGLAEFVRTVTISRNPAWASSWHTVYQERPLQEDAENGTRISPG